MALVEVRLERQVSEFTTVKVDIPEGVDEETLLDTLWDAGAKACWTPDTVEFFDYIISRPDES